jgi:uncharacterized protein (DUF1501 family)
MAPRCDRTGMDRRAFLRTLGQVTLATAMGPALFEAFGSPAAAAVLRSGSLETTLPVGTPIVVLVTLDGGNDPLNTLVPVDDPWYYDSAYGHGALALPAESTLALTGTGYRLHPALAFLAERWNTVGDVAFVLGVGEHELQTFSHFDAMKLWQTADASLLEPRGWLGRYNDQVRPGNPMASVCLGFGPRLEGVGVTSPVLVVKDTSLFRFALPYAATSGFQAALDHMATSQENGLRGQVARLLGTTFAISDRVRGASDATVTDGDHPSITDQLLQAALLIRAGLPCQTYTTAFGPFDTHGDQLAMQGSLLADLDDALRQFFSVLAASDRRADVFVAIVSEFGRQVTVNGNVGTDHGQAGLSILVGGGVQGGLYGEAPTLDPGGVTRPNRLHDALVPTLDFRSLEATILTRLAGDSGVVSAVLGGSFETLPALPGGPAGPKRGHRGNAGRTGAPGGAQADRPAPSAKPRSGGPGMLPESRPRR